jgi:hypothetical protein
MSHISDLIDIVIKSGLAQELKQNGFRKQGRTFRKSLSEAILITNIQGSKWNRGQAGNFTMNLGVYFPVVAELVWLPLPQAPDRPLEYDCLVRTRIGQLLPTHEDYWWAIDPSIDLHALGSDVTEKWSTYGKPWLERHARMKQARDFLVGQDMQWQAAIFSFVLGEAELAAGQLRKAAESAARQGNAQFVGVLDDWAETHQLMW